MIKRDNPLDRAYGRFGANYQPTSPASPAVTIARQAAEIHELRTKLALIDAQVRDVGLRQSTRGIAARAIIAIRLILTERQS